ncbi:type III secretion system translocon subunit SctE [Bordetella sp. BOR01]|uniref:type III secretion system translocon subunit SctE n=1 Tax=Bordetella sp. BOR01 TaxID=2854779 RepID=UPI001C451112|nr:type III secretion system translocon subunit SctE [Bordetella sp. BOR01]MBV7485205.1 type III secretion system translocon subunit SctE [Bordetella sp. BOR01]
MEIRSTPPMSAGVPDATGAPIGAEAALRLAQGIDLSALASQWASMVTSSKGSAPGALANANGQPAIASPSREFTADEMVDLLRALKTKSQDRQLESAKENIEANRINQQKNNEKQIAKINEWIEKSKEAESGGIFGKIFGWLGAIVAALAAALMVVAAVAVTAATAGAAGPIMCTLAAIAVAAAVSMVATQISSECGGPEISISNGITQAVAGLLTAFGVDPDLAQKIGAIVAGPAMVMTGTILVDPGGLGKMAGAIASVAGADEATAGYVAMGVGLAATLTVAVVMTVASMGAGAFAGAANAVGNVSAQTARTVTDVLKSTTEVVRGVAAVVQGVGSVGRGVETIKTAEKREDADKALADKKLLEALMAKLQAAMNEDREKLKEILQAMDESMQMVSKMINAAADSMSQVTANISKRAMV